VLRWWSGHQAVRYGLRDGGLGWEMVAVPQKGLQVVDKLHGPAIKVEIVYRTLRQVDMHEEQH
jgi:hypothetical protein